LRLTGTTNRKLKVFALVQIAASFVLVAAAAATVNTLLSLASVRSRFDTRQILAINVPVMREGRTTAQVVDYYREAMRQIRELPGVVNVAVGPVPWRDADDFALEFSADGQAPTAGEKPPRATYEVVSPGFFATLSMPVIEGRDFTDADRNSADLVALVSESVARQMFPKGNALNHYVAWTDPGLQFAPGGRPKPRRIIGIVPDVNNQNLASTPQMTVYHSFDQEQTFLPGRLLVQTHSDPYALVQPISRILRTLSADQPIERANTLEDIRAEVLSPEKLNVMVSGVFAGVALLVALVGVAGVLTFSVSARTREFGIRLALGSNPRHLLLRVMSEGAAMAVGGLALGLVCGFALARVAAAFVGGLKMPGLLPLVGSAVVLLVAAVIAAAIPAARAARVDVIQALRSE